MLATTRSWFEGLREFAAEQRARKPLVETACAAERAAERMILAAHLSTTLAGWEAILAGRGSAASGAGCDASPALVLTTSPVGIGLAAEQLATGSLPARSLSDCAVAVTELEYRLWCIRHPDDVYARHVTIWNWIKTRVPLQRRGDFARHPLG
ncbi:MAG: hypothetical protein ACKO1M_10000, partial [Planctomycetota bacterium]